MKTCILIDDDIDDREIFEIAFAQAGVESEFKSFNGGIEALTELSKPSFPINYIFLDVNMPGMTGRECLVEIRKLQHLHSVPVIIYTTSTNAFERKEFLSLGAFSVAAKPTKMTDLISLLKNTIV